MKWFSPWRSLGLSALLLSACVSPSEDLRGLGEQPPLNGAVFVTGGAFLTGRTAEDATFGELADGTAAPAASREVMPIADFVDVLMRSKVFQHVAVDSDAESRRRVSQLMLAGATDALFSELLERVRMQGFDYVLVVEELRDGPIEMQGTNGRWPVTFATWILLGVGALIPDRTFESRATLRVTLRELQMGRPLHESLLDAGTVDLALVERTDFWGLLSSILVPPFWVGDDRAAVKNSVGTTTQRRLLLRLARELKSESVRQRLRERAAADVTMSETAEGWKVIVTALEGLSVARLRGHAKLDAVAADTFAAVLLSSVKVDAGRYRYEALLPTMASGERVQVLVGTLRGGVASATFSPGSR